jgi:hypothetical protein
LFRRGSAQRAARERLQRRDAKGGSENREDGISRRICWWEDKDSSGCRYIQRRDKGHVDHTYQGMPHTAGEAFVVVLVATCGMSGGVGIFCVWHAAQGRVHFSTMPRSSHHRPSPLPIVPGVAAAASSLRP